MSGLLAGKVWQSNLDAYLKPLAAAMADIANDDGSSIFPSVAYLAWLLGKAERSVQYGLGELKTLGVINAVAHGRGGRGHAAEYHLHEEKLPTRPAWREKRKVATSAPFGPLKGAIPEAKGCKLERQRVQPTAPDPSLDTSITIKPLSPHGRLMDFLNSQNGDVGHAGKEGKAAKKILEKYNPEQAEACFLHLASQTWRDTAVTWTTVQGEIGAFVNKPRGGTILSDNGDEYTVMGADGTPSKRWRAPEAFAMATGKPLEEVKAKWN